MSDIGQAIRRQQQAAARRRRDRTSGGASADLGFDEEVVHCASCQARVQRGDVYASAAGEVCPACFVESQPDPARERVLSPPLIGAWLLIATMAPLTRSMDMAYFSGKGGMGWLLVGMLVTLFAFLATMDSARSLREALHPVSLDDDAEPVVDRLAQVRSVLAVLAGLTAIVLGPLLTMLPYLG